MLNTTVYLKEKYNKEFCFLPFAIKRLNYNFKAEFNYYRCKKNILRWILLYNASSQVLRDFFSIILQNKKEGDFLLGCCGAAAAEQKQNFPFEVAIIRKYLHIHIYFLSKEIVVLFPPQTLIILIIIEGFCVRHLHTPLTSYNH